MTQLKGQCAIAKVQTLVDNGIRIYLDFPETATLLAAQLMECKRLGVYLDVTFTEADREEIEEAKAKDRLDSDNDQTNDRKLHI